MSTASALKHQTGQHLSSVLIRVAIAQRTVFSVQAQDVPASLCETFSQAAPARGQRSAQKKRRGRCNKRGSP